MGDPASYHLLKMYGGNSDEVPEAMRQDQEPPVDAVHPRIFDEVLSGNNGSREFRDYRSRTTPAVTEASRLESFALSRYKLGKADIENNPAVKDALRLELYMEDFARGDVSLIAPKHQARGQPTDAEPQDVDQYDRMLHLRKTADERMRRLHERQAAQQESNLISILNKPLKETLSQLLMSENIERSIRREQVYTRMEREMAREEVQQSRAKRQSFKYQQKD